MSKHAFWWIMLFAALGSLLYNVIAYRRYRRSPEPMPPYAAGSVSLGFGLVLLILSGLLDMQGLLAQIALAASVLLSGVSMTLFILALRGAKRAER